MMHINMISLPADTVYHHQAEARAGPSLVIIRHITLGVTQRIVMIMISA